MLDLTQAEKVTRVPREFAQSPTVLAKRAGAMAKERSSAAFEDAGVVPFAYPVLAVLAQGTCATQAAIADTLRYDRSYLVGLLDELERAALIERRRDPGDRRRHFVSLTKAGESELLRLRAIMRDVDAELLAPLGAAERKTLIALLAKLVAAHDARYATD